MVDILTHEWGYYITFNHNNMLLLSLSQGKFHSSFLRLYLDVKAITKTVKKQQKQLISPYSLIIVDKHVINIF